MGMTLLKKKKAAKENVARVSKARDHHLFLKRRQCNLEVNLMRLKKSFMRYDDIGQQLSQR